MDIIRNNPYRILGVLSNASRKDIERNKSQIKAFAKVGRTPSFPYDFEESLVPVIRTEKSLNEAIGKLTFDKDKIAYGLFWFIDTMPTDTMALDYLRVGNIDECINTFSSKSSYSTYISLGILYIIKRDWSSAIYWYARFWEYTPFYEKFVLDITNSSATIALDEELDVFTTNLINSFHSVNWLTVLNNTKAIPGGKVELGDWLIKSRLYASLAPKCVNLIKSKLDSYLEEASNVSRTDANANLSMAAKLEQSCKELLSSLKSTLEYDNITYIRYADKVALQILDNCIYYYNNDQNNPVHPKNVLRLVRFCTKIAEGKLAKDRCKKNFDVIKEAYDNMCPQEVVEEVTFIENQMKRAFSKSDIIDNNWLIDSINECHNRLLDIAKSIGMNERYYWRLSERVVLFYLNKIIEFINAAMKAYDEAPQYNDYTELYQLRMLLKKCKPIFTKLQLFPRKNADSISNFGKNFQKFKELCQDYHVDEFNNSQAYSQPVYPRSSANNYQRRTTDYAPKSNSYSSNTRSKNVETDIKWTKAEKWFIGIAGVLLCIMLTYLCIAISNAPNPTPKKDVQSINCNTKPRTYLNTGNADKSPDTEETEVTNEPYEVTYFTTGDMPYRNIFGKGKYDKKTKNYLEIDNGGDTDAVIFLETLDGRKIRHAYICKNEKYRMKHIPAGKYIVKIMQGNSWNAEKDTGNGPLGGFMENISYSKSESYDPFEYPSYSSGKWGWYSITLYKTPDGNMSTQPVSEGEFF